MKKALYEVTFKVTETCMNGNEVTHKKSVYMPRFDEHTGKHIPEDVAIARCIAALEAEHYYNIQFIARRATFLTFA